VVMEFALTLESKMKLLQIAKRAIYDRLGQFYEENSTESSLGVELHQNAGVFVSVYVNGKLRGCLGQFESQLLLHKLVAQLAVSSARNDSRFQPVSITELNDLQIEISVLTPPLKIEAIDEIELGKHGIVIRKGARSGTFLPQVAMSTGWNLDEFLGHCSRDKAGLGWDGWKNADLFVYEAIVFSDFG
jgi:MEMO1 family protein